MTPRSIPSPVRFAQFALLKTAFSNLSVRNRHIFIERQFNDNPATLAQLGEIYNVSPERVRQIATRSAQKMQRLSKAPVLLRDYAMWNIH